MENLIGNEYISIKALENGVNIIGLTRGKDTKFHHTEKLDEGEVYIAQFTEITSAIKIKGKAEIYTKYGKIMSDTK
ncbi:MAG: trp RNA-binding attenuation protein MtrB [Clostridia bacterium]|nr:trp RNA-binding attenuation protein MtrB [Clostridia bacterium]